MQPTLAYQNFIDQQDNTGQFRINDGIAVDDTLAWFLPGKRGDHDVKAACSTSIPAPRTRTRET